ncbi:MAG: hypothetical protein WCK58_05620 [Chloroflexota bacterium]
MRSNRPGRLAAIVTALVIGLAAAACAPADQGDTPVAVVSQAMAKLAAKDIEGLRGLACAGQEDVIRNQLGLGQALGGDLVPGLDTQALLDAVKLDISDVKAGDAVIDGDVAQVPVSGNLKVTFDKTAMAPILKTMLAQSGRTMTDEQVNALLDTLAAYGQDLPLDQTVRLVREQGAWKVCQDTIPSPGAPASAGPGSS